MYFIKLKCKLWVSRSNNENSVILMAKWKKNNEPISNGHGMRILLLTWGDVTKSWLPIYTGVNFERTMPMLKMAYSFFVCDVSRSVHQRFWNIHTSMGWHETRQFSSFETLKIEDTIALFIYLFIFLFRICFKHLRLLSDVDFYHESLDSMYRFALRWFISATVITWMTTFNCILNQPQLCSIVVFRFECWMSHPKNLEHWFKFNRVYNRIDISNTWLLFKICRLKSVCIEIRKSITWDFIIHDVAAAPGPGVHW